MEHSTRFHGGFCFVLQFMRMYVLLACLCTICMSGACEGQKRALDILKLELQMFVNHYVYAGNETQVLGKSTSAINC